MEVARRAAATARLDEAHRLPEHSSPRGQMSLDALRRELVKESIIQEIILAELAEQRRESESEVRREVGLEYAGPQSLGTHPWLQLTTLPQHDRFPAWQGAQLHLQMPRLPEPRLEEGVMTPRVCVRDRIDEWYRPPWNKGFADENMLIHRARLPNKTLSGVKRKWTAETSASNKKQSSEKWICSLCHVNTYSEFTFEEHCAGYRHRSNVAELEWAKGAKRVSIAEASNGMQHNPTAWNCNICQVKCTGELDLNNHLKGRRHQENTEILWGESKRSEGKSGFKEAELYQKKEVKLVDMDQKPPSRWNCSICKANYTSESDLESHLRGRRHQKTVKAQSIDMDQKPTARWNCSICKANCTSESDLESHLRSRRHQNTVKAQSIDMDMDQKPTSRWNCSICKANCTSESDLESHLIGRRHQKTVKAQSIQGTSTTVASHNVAKNKQAVLSAHN